ncbi:hypothetical protein [Ferrovibrio xuzhouensis]|uniref:Uncharacterized protein n=1 Tax=Ferrovibrio xuzhouensis TaxID=1576914 RepID=A0ABV7VBV4_9PROT
MKRIDTSTAFVDKFGAGKNGFRNGDPLAAVLATRLIAEWCDHVQEQLAQCVESAGIPLDAGNYNQLYDAIVAITAGVNVVPLVEASPVAVPLAAGSAFTLGLTASRTLGNPTGVTLLKPFVIKIAQPAGGGCGLAYDTNWQFENGEAPAPTTTANAVDLLIGIGMPGGKVFAHMKNNIL